MLQPSYSPETIRACMYGDGDRDVCESDVGTLSRSDRVVLEAPENIAETAAETTISPEMASLYLLIIRIQMLMYYASTKQIRVSDALPIIPGMIDVLAIGGIGALKALSRRLGLPY